MDDATKAKDIMEKYAEKAEEEAKKKKEISQKRAMICGALGQVAGAVAEYAALDIAGLKAYPELLVKVPKECDAGAISMNIYEKGISLGSEKKYVVDMQCG